MDDEMVTALLNLEWLMRNRETYIDLPSMTVMYGDGGAPLDELKRRGMTPATR